MLTKSQQKQREEKKLTVAWMDKKDYAQLEELAKKNDVTVSALIRLAIRQMIVKNRGKELLKI